MSIQGSSIDVGATYTPSGGTATALKNRSNGTNHVVMYLDDGSDYADQTTIDFKVKEPKVNASSAGGYTQRRSESVTKTPKTLASGDTTIDKAGWFIAVSRETTDAEIQALVDLQVAQLLDADYADFREDQSTS